MRPDQFPLVPVVEEFLSVSLYLRLSLLLIPQRRRSVRLCHGPQVGDVVLTSSQ